MTVEKRHGEDRFTININLHEATMIFHALEWINDPEDKERFYTWMAEGEVEDRVAYAKLQRDWEVMIKGDQA